MGDRTFRKRYWSALWFLSFLAFVAVSPLDWWTGAIRTELITTVFGLVALSVPILAQRSPPVDAGRLRLFLFVSAAIGLFALMTGIFNGQTWEAYTTPQYAMLYLQGANPYTTQLVYSFTICAGPAANGLTACVTHYSHTYYAYLPLLTLLQIPPVPYTAFTFGCWLALVWVLRKQPVAIAAIGSPFVALLAANGYNDFPVLLLLTIAFVGQRTKWSTLSECLALGMKQFANVFVVGYYVICRRYRRAIVAFGISVAFLVPFLILNPQAVVCVAVLHEDPSCSNPIGGPFLVHLNYWLWPLWILAIYNDQIANWLRQRGAIGRRIATLTTGRASIEPEGRADAQASGRERRAPPIAYR